VLPGKPATSRVRFRRVGFSVHAVPRRVSKIAFDDDPDDPEPIETVPVEIDREILPASKLQPFSGNQRRLSRRFRWSRSEVCSTLLLDAVLLDAVAVPIVKSIPVEAFAIACRRAGILRRGGAGFGFQGPAGNRPKVCCRRTTVVFFESRLGRADRVERLRGGKRLFRSNHSSSVCELRGAAVSEYCWIAVFGAFGNAEFVNCGRGDGIRSLLGTSTVLERYVRVEAFVNSDRSCWRWTAGTAAFIAVFRRGGLRVKAVGPAA